MAAVTGNSDAIWTNSDGLRIRFGTEKSRDAKEGSPIQAGNYKVYEFEILGTDLPLHTETQERYLNRVPSVFLPAGHMLVEAKLVVMTAFAGANATLSLGLAEQDGTTVAADGIDATIAVTEIDTVGDTITCDGALVGTILAKDSALTVTVGTASFTAGKAKLLVTLLPQIV